MKIESDGPVTLHHSGTAKLVTSSGGVGVTGDITVSGNVDGVDISALNTTVGTKLANVVEDSSPQLGGELQGNGHHIRLTDTKYVWFGTTGTVISGANSSIEYTSKSINQFFGCSGVSVGIGTADDIRANATIYGYENVNL